MPWAEVAAAEDGRRRLLVRLLVLSVSPELTVGRRSRAIEVYLVTEGDSGHVMRFQGSNSGGRDVVMYGKFDFPKMIDFSCE